MWIAGPISMPAYIFKELIKNHKDEGLLTILIKSYNFELVLVNFVVSIIQVANIQ